MKHERKVAQAFNYGFTTLYNDFPGPFVRSLGAPGKFVRKANTSVRTMDGKSGDIDSAYVADPDNEIIFVPTLVLLGHQRLPVNEDKSEKIGLHYFIQGISDERLPAMVCIASHQDIDKHVQKYGINKDNVIINFIFIDLGEEDNTKRLNKIRSKLDTSDMISIDDGMNIGITLLFAPEKYAKEITRELLDYFLNRKIESDKLKNTLYRVFYAMIDAYFDDEKEFQEMITMLKKDMTNKEETDLESDIIRQNRLDEALDRNDKFAEENAKLNDRNAKFAEENAQLNDRNAKFAEEISKLNDKTAQLSEEISKLNDEKEKSDTFINLLLLSKLEGIPTNGINNVFNQIKTPYKSSLQKF